MKIDSHQHFWTPGRGDHTWMPLDNPILNRTYLPADLAPNLVLPVIGMVMALVISILLFTLEMLGTVIKSGVLAIRLFANMFAGHMVLATILLFIVTIGEPSRHFTPLWGTVTAASVLGVVALSLLELFVASFFVIWFGLGALLVGVALLVVPDMVFSTQILAWTAASVALTMLWFKVLRQDGGRTRSL